MSPHILRTRSATLRIRLLALAGALGVAMLTACGGGGGDGGGGTGPTPSRVTAVVLSPDSVSMRIGTTVTVTASGRDAAGAIVPNRPVAWASTDVSIARVDASGVVTAVAPGIARVTATIDGRVAGMTVVVFAPVATITVTSPTQTLGTGGTLQLTAVLKDAVGGAIGDRQVTWTSSDNSVATVSSTGLVTGIKAGSTTITAQSEGILGTLSIVVIVAQPPTITTVSPDILTPGATATITGSNFGSNPSEVTVTVNGLAAQVLTATLTELKVQLPVFPCQATRAVPIEVRSIGGLATSSRTLKVARTLPALAVGATHQLAGVSELACNELPVSAGRYLLNVVNATRVATSATPVQLRGIGADASTTVAARTIAAAPLPRRAAAGSPALRPAGAQVHDTEHLRYVEEARDLFRRFGNPREALRRTRLLDRASSAITGSASASGAAMDAVPLTVGASATLKFRAANSCATFTSLPARVVYVGTRSVILEATDAPLAGTMDEDYQKLGGEFDQVMFDILSRNFGNPLVLDSELDANGRIVMLFTNSVNTRNANLLGFVSPCDFYPPTYHSSLVASNQAEIFYARVPTSNTGTTFNSRAGWLRIMRSTLIHEAKHITSIGYRIAQDRQVPPIEEAWLEEGTAQIASELYARAVYPPPGTTFRGNGLYRNTLYCEVRPSNPDCGGIPSLVTDFFDFLQTYYPGTEGKSFFNSPAIDQDIYGSAWLFSRWAADQFATDEAAFFKALTQTTRTGLDNVAALTKVTPEELERDFMLALYADDYPGVAFPAGARYTIPSWHTRDLWAGLNTDFPSFFTSPFPLQVRTAPFGNFGVQSTQLAGGGAMYVEISGTQPQAQFIELTSSAGVPLPVGTTLRLSILRVQ